MKDYYTMMLDNVTSKITEGNTAPRGRILDCNLNIIVDNTSIKTITYLKPKNITANEEIKMAYEIQKYIDLDYDKQNTRNIKEFYILIKQAETDKLITKEEYENLDNRKLSVEDIYELKINRITEDDLKSLNTDDLHASYIYYLMNKGYSYDEKIIKERATAKEYAYFSENNINGFKTKLSWERTYPYGDVFRSILGDLSTNGIPDEDKNYYLNLGYNLNDTVGISGLEKQYESVLKGEKEVYKVNDDNTLSLIKNGIKGNDIVLSIDINVQKELEDMLNEEIIKTKQEPNTDFYNKSFVIIENPTTGEIIAMAGRKYLDNKTIDYDYGAITYAVTPGSIVKGASMSVGYKQKVIDIGTVMEDRCIKLNNLPEKCSWKTLGFVNDLQALEYSSNVYQYKIAMLVGGFNYSYNKDLIINPKAFDIYRNIFYQYGLGVKTGLDYPKEETGVHGTNVAGDLLINFAIGQYDTYTTLQLSQYMSTIANKGRRMKTSFLKKIIKTNYNNQIDVIYEKEPIVLNKVQLDDVYIERIRKGLNLVTTYGTGVGYMSVNSSGGKTGTSESFVDVNNDGSIDYESITNTFSGFAPFDNPIMVVTAVSPDVQNPNRGTFKSLVNKRIIQKATTIFFNHYDELGNLK